MNEEDQKAVMKLVMKLEIEIKEILNGIEKRLSKLEIYAKNKGDNSRKECYSQAQEDILKMIKNYNEKRYGHSKNTCESQEYNAINKLIGEVEKTLYENNN